MELVSNEYHTPDEQRWAAFLTAAEIKFEYKKSGVVIEGEQYLPDFWLNDLSLFLETSDTSLQVNKFERCQSLAHASGHSVMLAVGPPKQEGQIYFFRPAAIENDPFAGAQYYLADDRRNANEFWLVSDGGHEFAIGPETGPDHGRHPLVHTATLRGYEASKSVRVKPVVLKAKNDSGMKPCIRCAKSIGVSARFCPTCKYYQDWRAILQDFGLLRKEVIGVLALFTAITTAAVSFFGWVKGGVAEPNFVLSSEPELIEFSNSWMRQTSKLRIHLNASNAGNIEASIDAVLVENSTAESQLYLVEGCGSKVVTNEVKTTKPDGSIVSFSFSIPYTIYLVGQPPFDDLVPKENERMPNQWAVAGAGQSARTSVAEGINLIVYWSDATGNRFFTVVKKSSQGRRQNRYVLSDMETAQGGPTDRYCFDLQLRKKLRLDEVWKHHEEKFSEGSVHPVAK